MNAWIVFAHLRDNRVLATFERRTRMRHKANLFLPVGRWIGRDSLKSPGMPNRYMHARVRSAGGMDRYVAKCNLFRQKKPTVHPFCVAGYPLRQNGTRSTTCY